jgi:hypothetical protein
MGAAGEIHVLIESCLASSHNRRTDAFDEMGPQLGKPLRRESRMLLVKDDLAGGLSV